MGLLDSMKPTPRHRMMGLLADALTAANDYANKPDQAMPGGKANPPLAMLSGLLGLPSLATTAQRASYGEPLTNAGKANVPFLKRETADALMMAPLSPRTALGVVGMGAGGIGSSGALHAAGMLPRELSEVGRASRMSEMGLERGWFRGGPAPANDRRTGPWYTKSQEEAAGYAKGGDVREYAIPAAGYLDASRGYSNKLAHDVAAILDDPFYGKQGAHLARELRTFGPGEGLTGGQLWQSLEARFGNDGAADVMGKLGAFKGVKGITGPDEAYVFRSGAVRDANKAQFDPGKYTADNIMAGVLGATLLGGSGLAGLQGKRLQD